MGNIDLQSKYSKILIQNGILDEISQVDTSIPDLLGEQFGSICELVKIQFKEEQKADCYLFVKKMLPIPDPVQRQFFEASILKEGSFLTTFVQDMKNYCIDITGNNEIAIDELFPKTYYADRDEIIMANLTMQGYVMLKKADRQDVSHAIMVLEGLAKFHAVSYAMVLENDGVRPFTEKYPIFIDDAMTKPEIVEQMSPPYELMLQMLRASTVKGSSETYSKLVGFRGKWLEMMIELILKALDTKFMVTNHGDFWNNNMLFAGSDSDEMKVVFLDVGNGRMGSPCLDIAYYIFTSVKPEVRIQWKELLRIYFDKFVEVSQLLLGSAPEVTFEEFVSEYRGLCKFGLLLGMFQAVALEAMQHMDTKDGFFLNNLTAAVNSWIAVNKKKLDGVVTTVIGLVNDFEEIATL